jgi:hypothetical protein
MTTTTSGPTGPTKMATADIHRGSEVARLTAALENPPEGLSIVAISGPGGVGKTFLLSHVLERVVPDKLGYLTLTADAANPDTRGDLLGIIEGQLFRRVLGPPADRTRDYFPHLRDVAEEHRSVVALAMTELAKKGAPDSVVRAARLLLRAGRILNGTVAKTRAVLDAAGVENAAVEGAVDQAWEMVRGLPGLRDSTALPGPLRDVLGITRRNRVKRDLYALTASVIRDDLEAALDGEERTADRVMGTQRRIPGLDRLLLVVDDYEAMAALLGDFLVGALVPALATAPFRTVLVVLGRDDLEVTHPGWAQHCRRFLKEQIRLTAFDEKAASDLFAAAGIEPARWPSLFAATQGYPFLISLAVEEAADSAANSVVFLRRFYDRTTRWMTEREREWFVRVCYLERVDEDTLRTVFPGQDVSKIQDWFEREPSIRDPSAPYFRLRPMVRDKMLRYLEVRAPSRHRELTEAAAGRGEVQP